MPSLGGLLITGLWRLFLKHLHSIRMRLESRLWHRLGRFVGIFGVIADIGLAIIDRLACFCAIVFPCLQLGILLLELCLVDELLFYLFYWS